MQIYQFPLVIFLSINFSINKVINTSAVYSEFSFTYKDSSVSVNLYDASFCSILL